MLNRDFEPAKLRLQVISSVTLALNTPYRFHVPRNQEADDVCALVLNWYN
jgi:hypothetical protein